MKDRATIIKELKSTKIKIDGHCHAGISLASYRNFGYPYAISFEDHVIRMRCFGMDRAVLFPFVESLYYVKDLNKSAIETTKQYCQFPYELENKNLLKEIYDIFPEYSDRAIPFLIFDPSRETEKQALFFEELYQQYPVFGLKTVTSYIQAYVTDLETVGAPILEFARSRDLPIIFHSAYYSKNPWASVYELQKFAERNPDVRIVIAHSAKFVKSVLDRANELDNCFVDISAFIIHCHLAASNEEVIPDVIKRFAADYTDPFDVLFKLIEAYPTKIIWGSDSPYYYWIQKYFDSDGVLHDQHLKCSYEDEINLLKRLPQDYTDKICYENTIRFLFG